MLERLPHQIDELPGGVDWCKDVFEPEIFFQIDDKDFQGPLSLAFMEPQFSETLCVSPLVFEYMTHRYVMWVLFFFVVVVDFVVIYPPRIF